MGRRRCYGTIFRYATIASTALGMMVLVVLITDVIRRGAGEIDLHFLTSFPSRFPAKAGLRTALLGTFWMIAMTALISFPIGVGSAI
ncbi:MAG TPA: phosphate ABC transporter, permease protein PstA, partial [Chloroflexota bacterium]|nr:phosphate ABC transporter, permease protein PstA [Chloroflexota bacterium]